MAVSSCNPSVLTQRVDGVGPQLTKRDVSKSIDPGQNNGNQLEDGQT